MHEKRKPKQNKTKEKFKNSSCSLSLSLSLSLSMLTVWGRKPYAQRMDGYMNACIRKCMHAFTHV